MRIRRRLQQLMFQSTRSNLNSARAMLAAVWGMLCVLIFAAPILRSHSCQTAASVLYLSFSCFCHQIPERSFTILGQPLAVCHRCCGIYLGLLLGVFVKYPMIRRSPQACRLWIAAAGIPILLDVILSYLGFWTNTCLSRFFTGLLFGNLISFLLVQGMAEFLSEIPWRNAAAGNVPIEESVYE